MKKCERLQVDLIGLWCQNVPHKEKIVNWIPHDFCLNWYHFVKYYTLAISCEKADKLVWNLKTNSQLGMNYKAFQEKTSTGFLFGILGCFDNVDCFCLYYHQMKTEEATHILKDFSCLCVEKLTLVWGNIYMLPIYTKVTWSV